MLIWLASYPRSGNTYVRIVLKGIFGLQTYSLNGDGDERVFSSRPGVLNVVGHRITRSRDNALVEEARASDDLYIIKTHEPPITDDPAIYIVRDGRSAIVSYHNYCKDVEKLTISLDNVIAGKVYAGSWSDHFKSWRPLRRNNTLFLRFEDITKHGDWLVSQLATFCNLRPRHSIWRSFPELHEMFPEFFRGGDDEKNIAEIKTSLPHFMKKHGVLMKQLSYL